jgi:Spy/CpxP family protein refolding chaperone
MHADVRLARIDLGELMGSEKPDKSAIARKMKEVADLEYKIETAQLDHQFAIRGMLTEEQLKEFKQMHPRMGYGQRFHEGRGHGCYCGACGEEVGRGPHGPGFAPFPDDDE